MKQNAYYDMFVAQLRDIYDSESQIIDGLPKVISAATNKELKEALTNHLEETKNQLSRLKQIFKLINENPTGTQCKGMKGILGECEEVLNQAYTPAVKDVSLIIACQKVEHYEISAYGSARAVAHHLNHIGLDDRIDFDEIADILQQNLDEEAAADELLTEIAEGGFFTEGINDEAEKEVSSANQKIDRQ